MIAQISKIIATESTLMRDTQSQRERFEQTARELGVELDEEKLKDALRRMGYHDTIARDEKPTDPDKAE
ncbi:hypothetical protein ACLJK8_22770 [Amaricoccus sp. W119]